MPTMEQLGDHLRAMGQVTIRLESDGSATLKSPTAIRAASFVVPRPSLTVLIDGKPLQTVRSDKWETVFFTDLAADQAVKVELRDAKGRPVSLLKPAGSPTLIAEANQVRDVIR